MHAGEGLNFLPAIDRYILRLVLGPMTAVFVVAASLLVLDKMLKLFDFVASEGGPVSVVFKMLANLLPEYASLAIPLGLMLGILFAFRRLALNSELDLLGATGLSFNRMMRMPYVLTVILAGLNLAIVGYLQPLSRYYYEQLQFDLRSGALGASIKVGEFTTLQDRMALRIESSEEEGRKLIGIFVRVADKNGQTLAISAREGRFMALAQHPDTIVLRLSDGRTVQGAPGISPRVLGFTRFDLPIDLPAIEQFRKRSSTAEREAILPELLRIGWNSATTEQQRNQAQAGFNYRMVEVVMMFLLPLLAVSLAIPPKRSTSGLGIFLSIILVVAYHKVNEGAQAAAAQGRLDPTLALWGPFVVVAVLIVWMYYRVAYVPGGQAIGALEKVFAGIGGAIKRLIWRRGTSAVEPA
jgi:lipopolysaccharide export system permease protein